jgi:hypothetical protein
VSKDPYLSAIRQHWSTIKTAFLDQYAKRPIIEYQLPEQVVCSYPASAYIDGLTVRSRDATRLQYQEACARGHILVFVRDSDQRVLRSYEFPFDDAAAIEPPPRHARRKRL